MARPPRLLSAYANFISTSCPKNRKTVPTNVRLTSRFPHHESVYVFLPFFSLAQERPPRGERCPPGREWRWACGRGQHDGEPGGGPSSKAKARAASQQVKAENSSADSASTLEGDRHQANGVQGLANAYGASAGVACPH